MTETSNSVAQLFKCYKTSCKIILIAVIFSSPAKAVK